MKHPTEKQLYLWLRSKKKLAHDETVYISEHLELCQLCNERLNTLQSYYNDLEREISRGPGKNERTIVSKIFQRRTKKALSSGSLLQTYEAPLDEYRSSMSVKVKNYLQKHPAGSTTITFGTFFLAVFLFIVQPWKSEDINPVYVEVKKSLLTAFDRSGEMIWSIPADGMPNGVSSSDGPHDAGQPNYLVLEDVDGDGIKEILLTGDGDREGFARDSLYCLNSDGILRWKQGIELPGSFIHSTNQNIGWWRMLGFFTHSSNNQQNPRLFAYARAGNWSPSVFYEIEPSTGNILQEYWHTGHIQTVTVYKNTASGEDELLIGAINDTYDLASVAVLNLDDFYGLAPGREIFEANTIPPANQKYYITFQPTIITKLYHTAPYNKVKEIIQARDGNLIIHTEELLGRLSEVQSVSIYYILESDYSVADVYGDDHFIKVYTEKHEAGEIEEPLSEMFWEDLKHSVRYWDEATSRFVNQDELEE